MAEEKQKITGKSENAKNKLSNALRKNLQRRKSPKRTHANITSQESTK